MIYKYRLNWMLQGVLMLAASQLFIGPVSAADDSATVADLKARLAVVEKDLGQLVEAEGKVSLLLARV